MKSFSIENFKVLAHKSELTILLENLVGATFAYDMWAETDAGVTDIFMKCTFSIFLVSFSKAL